MERYEPLPSVEHHKGTGRIEFNNSGKLETRNSEERKDKFAKLLRLARLLKAFRDREKAKLIVDYLLVIFGHK